MSQVDMETTELKTFQQWSDLGYKILKGSKARWVNGVAVFSRDQVIHRTTYVVPRQFADFDREEDSELADFYGISPWGGD